MINLKAAILHDLEARRFKGRAVSRLGDEPQLEPDQSGFPREGEAFPHQAGEFGFVAKHINNIHGFI